MRVQNTRRPGLTVLEMSIALFILMVALGGVLQLVTTAARQRRTSEERRLALAEIANQAERLAALSWDETTEDKLKALAPSEELLKASPSAKLSATVRDEAGPPAARRIRLEVTWTNSVGQRVDPLGVTVWKYSPVEANP